VSVEGSVGLAESRVQLAQLYLSLGSRRVVQIEQLTKLLLREVSDKRYKPTFETTNGHSPVIIKFRLHLELRS